MKLLFRECQPDDFDAVRDLLNVVFARAHMTAEGTASWVAEDFTAPVAIAEGEIAGAIPLKRRVYRVAPDAEVVAWVEHRVGVAEPLRGQGLGSGMQACAQEFLQGRGDVLLVYRGHERSDGYRFYDANGLHDVTYFRTVTLDPADAAPPSVRRLEAADFFERGAAWLEIFDDCYRDFGGFPSRGPGYLRHIIEQGIWTTAIRTTMACWVAEEGGRPQGYAIAGQREASWDDPAWDVMEIAARGGSPATLGALLDAVRGQGQPVRCRVSTAAPIAAVPAVRAALGPRERASMIMVHVLDIESTGRKVWRPVPELADVEVRAWTPRREGVVHRAPSPARTVTLELKEPMLSRLLMRRLDVAAAVREERITLDGARPGDAEAIAQALPPCPWVYHHIDYL